jgi:hypothetical protein
VNPSDLASVAKGETTAVVGTPATRESAGPPNAPPNGNEPEERFLKRLARRSKFLGEVLVELIVDGLWLAAVYGWYHFINLLFDLLVVWINRLVTWMGGTISAEAVDPFEYWTLFAVKAVLTVVPGLAVVFYVVIDFIGIIRRIWEKRPWRKQK